MLNFDDIAIYLLLVKVSKVYGVAPSSSIEMEDFFKGLLKGYGDKNNPNHIEAWLHRQISEAFVSLGVRPVWKQDPEWPLQNGKPMIFIGQIDIQVLEGSEAASLFHDHTTFYNFYAPTDVHEEVIQQL